MKFLRHSGPFLRIGTRKRGTRSVRTRHVAPCLDCLTSEPDAITAPTIGSEAVLFLGPFLVAQNASGIRNGMTSAFGALRTPATKLFNWLRFLPALPLHQLLTDC